MPPCTPFPRCSGSTSTSLQTIVRYGINVRRMKILVVGGGAREHALAWKLAGERGVRDVICAPGNPGIAAHARCIPAEASNPRALLAIAARESVDLTVVGPELPLSVGIADLLLPEGRAYCWVDEGGCGAGMGARCLRKTSWSGIACPRRVSACAIPQPPRTTRSQRKTSVTRLCSAHGLAAGKGVVIAEDRAMADETIRAAMIDRLWRCWRPGCARRVSCWRRGRTSCWPMAPRACRSRPPRINKRIFDNDRGPNTGGMERSRRVRE